MDWIRGYLYPSGNGRKIGFNCNGASTEEFVLVNPVSGLVYIKDAGSEGYLATVGTLGHYKLAVFDEQYFVDINKSMTKVEAPQEVIAPAKKKKK